MISLAFTFAAALAIGPYVPSSNDYLGEANFTALGLQRYWETDLPLEPGDAPVSASLRDESLYVATRQGNLVALHAPTGLALWVQSPAGRGGTILAPQHVWTPEGTGATAVAAGRSVYVLNRLTGEMISEFKPGFAAGASPVGDLENLFLPGSDGNMHALQWLAGQTRRPARLWQVHTGGPITSEPVYDGEDLYFASRDGTVHSCVGFNRVLNWSYRTAGPVTANIVLHDDALFVASQDRSLYRLDAGVGVVRWQRRLPTVLTDSPVVAGRMVYQRAPGEGLFAVDAESGEPLWRQQEARAYLAGRGNTAYLLSADGTHLLAADNATGEVRASVEIPHTAAVAANPDGDAIYLFSSWSRALCLRAADVPYLTLDEITAVRIRIAGIDGGTNRGMEATKPSPTEEEEDMRDDPLRSRTNIPPVSGG